MSQGDLDRAVWERLRDLNRAFLPASPIAEQDLLAGRTAQLFSLVELVDTPGSHAAIYGERGVGKTSVAAVLEHLVSDRVLTARINCSNDDDFGLVWKNMIRAIQRVARQRDWAPLDEEQVRKLIGYEPVPASVTELLREVCKSGTCLLIFDEFDVIGESIVSEHFGNLMKALSDLHIPARVVIVGVAEDIDSLLLGHASIARGLQQVKMPRLHAGELRGIVEEGARRANLRYTPNIMARIVGLSQGLAHYTHLLAKQAGRAAILGGTDLVGEEFWHPALEGALGAAEQQIVDLYQTATVSSQQTILPDLLVACALAKKDMQGFFRPADIVVPLSQLLGRELGIPSFNKNLAALANERGPALESRVFADKRARYRFLNPLLQPYVLLDAMFQQRLDADTIEDWNLWGPK